MICNTILIHSNFQIWSLFCCKVYFVLYSQSDRPQICCDIKATLSRELDLFISLSLYFLSHVLYLLSKDLHGFVCCKRSWFCVFFSLLQRVNRHYLQFVITPAESSFLVYNSNTTALHFIRPYQLCSFSNLVLDVSVCMHLYVFTCSHMSECEWVVRWENECFIATCVFVLYKV